MRLTNAWLWIGLVLTAVFWSKPATAVYEMTHKAQEDYDYQLEQYRSEYELFIVKRETFVRSGTFRAQEELVTAAKQMLERRTRAWWTYFQYLRTHVHEQPGFEDTTKADLSQKIMTVQSDLDSHSASVAGELTREGLLALAQELNVKNEPYTKLAYETLIGLQLSKMKAAVRQIEKLGLTIKEAVTVQMRNVALREVRLRGFDELQILVAQIDEAIAKQEDNIAQYGTSFINRTGYQQTVKELDTAYQNLARAKQLLRELSLGMEL